MTSESSPLFAAVRNIVTLATGSAPVAEVEQVVRACFPLTRGATAQEREQVLAQLAPALSVADLERAILVGYLCGALVEDGVPSAAIEEPLLARYLELARRARKFHDALAGHDDAETASRLPREHAAYQLLARSAAPCIAVLAASARAREWGRPLVGMLEPLTGTLQCAREISALALVLDDALFLALEPSSMTGIRGRISGVSDNAQLQILLMAAYPQPASAPPRVAQEIVDNARGLGPESLDQTVAATFTAYDWRATTRDLASATEHVIRNEARPAAIPVFEDARVLLLGPPQYARTWRVQREFARLKAELRVEETLSKGEVSTLLARMERAARA